MANTFLLTLLGTDTKYEKRLEGSKVRVETLSFMHDAAVGADITENVKEHKYYSLTDLDLAQTHTNGASAAGAAADSNQTNGRLTKAIIDGPSTTGGNVYEKIGEATLAILDQIAQGQTTINIQAHSRGACEAIIVSHEIQRLIDLALLKKPEERITPEDVQNSENPTTKDYLKTGTYKPDWIKKIVENQDLVKNLKNTKVNIFNIDPVPGDSQAMNWFHSLASPVRMMANAATYIFKSATGFFRVIPENVGKLSLENFPWNDQRFFKLPKCVDNYTQAIPEYEESAFFNSVLPTAESSGTTVKKIIFGGNHATASGCMGYQTKEKDKPVRVKIKTAKDPRDLTSGYNEEEKEFDTSTAQELIACKIADFHQSSAGVVYDFDQETCKEKDKASYPNDWSKFNLTPLKEILSDFDRASSADKQKKYLDMYNKMAANYSGYQALADGHYAYKDGRRAHMTKMGRMLRLENGEVILERNLDYRYGENGQMLFVSQEHAELYINSLIGDTTIKLDDNVEKELEKIEINNPGITEAFNLLYNFIKVIELPASVQQDGLATALSNNVVIEDIKRALEVSLEKLGSSAEFNTSEIMAAELNNLHKSLLTNGTPKQGGEGQTKEEWIQITNDGRDVNAKEEPRQKLCNELSQKLGSLRSDYFENYIASIKPRISTNGFEYLEDANNCDKKTYYIALKRAVINDFKILLSEYSKCLIIAGEINDYLRAGHEIDNKSLVVLVNKMAKLKQSIEKLSELQPIKTYFETASIRKFVEKHGAEIAKASSPTKAKVAKRSSSESDDNSNGEQHSEVQKFTNTIEEKLLLDTIKEVNSIIAEPAIPSRAGASASAVAAAAADQQEQTVTPQQLSNFLKNFDTKYEGHLSKLRTEISAAEDEIAETKARTIIHRDEAEARDRTAAQIAETVARATAHREETEARATAQRAEAEARVVLHIDENGTRAAINKARKDDAKLANIKEPIAELNGKHLCGAASRAAQAALAHNKSKDGFFKRIWKAILKFLSLLCPCNWFCGSKDKTANPNPITAVPPPVTLAGAPPMNIRDATAARQLSEELKVDDSRELDHSEDTQARRDVSGSPRSR